MDSYVTAEQRELREERELRDNHNASLAVPSPTPLPAVAKHSIIKLTPDPASYGDPSAWEHVRVSPSPSPSPSPLSPAPAPSTATTTTTADTNTLSGPGMFDKASERLHELSSTVGNKIEQFAAHHKDFQKQNTTPNQHTPVVSDAEREYYGAKKSEEDGIQRDQDREYEASLV